MNLIKYFLVSIGVIAALFTSAIVRACETSTIVKPTPFMGNNDEIFVLLNGSIWQVKYEYQYLYEYRPEVVICAAENKLIVKGKTLNVVPLTRQSGGIPSGRSIVKSRIDGDFNGWEGETIYKLQNGQIWQQSSYHYHYHYAYAPEVLIYLEGGSYKMIVEGDNDQPISVRRIN